MKPQILSEPTSITIDIVLYNQLNGPPDSNALLGHQRIPPLVQCAKLAYRHQTNAMKKFGGL